MRYLAIMLLIVGCGKESPNIDTDYGPFADIVREFESYGGGEVDVDISLDDMVGEDISVVAKCYDSDNDRIVIRRAYWDASGPNERAIVLLHELGHCVLGRNHYNALNSAGEPMSLMNKYVMSPIVFAKNRQYYLTELVSSD